MERMDYLDNSQSRPSWMKFKMPQRSRSTVFAGVALVIAAILIFSWIILGIVSPTTSIAPAFSLSHADSDSLLDTTMNETLGVRGTAASSSHLSNYVQFQKIFVINLASRTDRRDAMALSASLSGIKVEFIDAVTEVDLDAAIPHKAPDFDLSELSMSLHASWRSHVNAIRTVVEQGLSSALILEDDADWDIRIKSQLRDWAKATQLLLQPVKGTNDSFLDPTYPSKGPTKGDDPHTIIDFSNPSGRVVKPTTSAYGDIDRWDVLWAGHCGQHFAHPNSGCPRTPLGRVVMFNDSTVPQAQHYYNYWSGDEYVQTQENHTRVTHWSCEQVCNTAYAVSHQGAQRLLYEFGMNEYHGMSDAMLREICDGEAPYNMRTCLSVSPPLFNQFDYKKAPEISYTHNIRLSVKANAEKLVNGETDYFDAWADQ